MDADEALILVQTFYCLRCGVGVVPHKSVVKYILTGEFPMLCFLCWCATDEYDEVKNGWKRERTKNGRGLDKLRFDQARQGASQEDVRGAERPE